MTSRKKNLINRVKEQLKVRREEIADELKKLYDERSEIRKADGDIDDISQLIDKKIAEISTINNDLARKDKKSSNIQWTDGNYQATARGNGARKAAIVDNSEYDRFQKTKSIVDTGPTALWLQPGILVKARGRTIPGIVLEVRSNYATVLFGGTEVNTRKLALRPAEWED